jgi:hypothetical protein
VNLKKYLDYLLNEQIDKADEVRISLVLKKLYKFISLNDDISFNQMKFHTLENESLWFSSVRELNDPYEFKCMYIDYSKLEEANHPENYIKAYENFFDFFLQRLAVVSMTKNSFDYLPMWAYYSNNYNGFCVEYDVVDPIPWFSVIYEENRIPIASTIANFFTSFENMIRLDKTEDDNVKFYAYLLQHQLYLKHKSWESEKEFGCVQLLNDKFDKGKNVKLSSVGLKTSKICVGYNCSPENKDELNKISIRLGCGNVLQTKISNNKYLLIQ